MLHTLREQQKPRVWAALFWQDAPQPRLVEYKPAPRSTFQDNHNRKTSVLSCDAHLGARTKNYPDRSFLNLLQSFFGILKAFSCRVSQKRSRCRTGAGGNCSRLPVQDATILLEPGTPDSPLRLMSFEGVWQTLVRKIPAAVCGGRPSKRATFKLHRTVARIESQDALSCDVAEHCIQLWSMSLQAT